MRQQWWIFFLLWPLIAIGWCLASPALDWWFPSAAMSPLGKQIDDLFYLILWIVTIVYIGTQVAMVYVLFRFSGDASRKGWCPARRNWGPGAVQAGLSRDRMPPCAI